MSKTKINQNFSLVTAQAYLVHKLTVYKTMSSNSKFTSSVFYNSKIHTAHKVSVAGKNLPKALSNFKVLSRNWFNINNHFVLSHTVQYCSL